MTQNRIISKGIIKSLKTYLQNTIHQNLQNPVFKQKFVVLNAFLIKQEAVNLRGQKKNKVGVRKKSKGKNKN